MGCNRNHILKLCLARVFLVFFVAISCIEQVSGQGLLDLLEEGESENKEFVFGTFKATRLVNGHSIETTGKHELLFLITHRFESIDRGPYDLFGLDFSQIRLGFEYGLTDRLDLGIGRSSYQKLFDGFIKYKLIRQSTGNKSFPMSLTFFSTMALKGEKWTDETKAYIMPHRMYYVHQLLIARKFTPGFSFQIMPTVVYRNLVATPDDQNLVMAVGAGGRSKITNMISLNAEYYYLLPGKTADDFSDVLSVGIDLETGGHVFQLVFSNSRGTHEKSVIAETTGRWPDADIYFVFNISRYFSLKKHQ